VTPDITHPVRLVVLRERVRVRKSMAAADEDDELLLAGATSEDLVDDMMML